MRKPLSLRQNFVAAICRIQTGLNSCDVSQRKNKHKQSCRSVCTHLRQIAATKFKSTNEEAQLVSRYVKFQLVYISSPSKSITCTEQVSYRSDLSQHQCRRRGDLSRYVAAICRTVCLGLYRERVHDITWSKCCEWKTFVNLLNMQKQYETNVREKNDEGFSLSLRVKTTLNYISIFFCFCLFLGFHHNINVK